MTTGWCSCNIFCQGIPRGHTTRLRSFIYDPRARCIKRASEEERKKKLFKIPFSRRQKTAVICLWRTSDRERASKTWKTSYRFVKDWNNNSSTLEKSYYEIQFAAFSSSALPHQLSRFFVIRKRYPINFIRKHWSDTNRFACSFLLHKREHLVGMFRPQSDSQQQQSSIACPLILCRLVAQAELSSESHSIEIELLMLKCDH